MTKETNLEHYKKELEKILNEEFANTSVVFDKVKKNCDSNIRSCCWTTYTRDILEWMSQPYKEPILNDTEREYLAAVIRPFREEIDTISKFRNLTNDEHYIFITMKNQNWFSLPRFPKGTMYKGMKDGRHYSLEELGL